jgi:ParB family chromosome partitioning protein
MKVPLTDIVIRERVRQDIGDLTPLMESMQKHGQLNPINITRENELIAGHRRLLSAKELGWTYIDALIIDRDSQIEKLQLELEENVHRKDFSPEELLAGYRKLEKLLRPRLTRRVANFFGNLFGRIFGRRKRRKQDRTPRPTLGTTADITQTEELAKASEAQTDSHTEVGQYGV